MAITMDIEGAAFLLTVALAMVAHWWGCWKHPQGFKLGDVVRTSHGVGQVVMSQWNWFTVEHKPGSVTSWRHVDPREVRHANIIERAAWRLIHGAQYHES